MTQKSSSETTIELIDKHLSQNIGTEIDNDTLPKNPGFETASQAANEAISKKESEKTTTQATGIFASKVIPKGSFGNCISDSMENKLADNQARKAFCDGIPGFSDFTTSNANRKLNTSQNRRGN